MVEHGPPPLSPDERLAFIAAHPWTFARTMPQYPHWYVVKDRCRDPVEFERMVIAIRLDGYVELWGTKKRRFICLNIGDYKYWTMGNPLSQTTIINRGKPTPPHSRVEAAQ